MAGKREKKKRGCCGIFLWLLIILIALGVGGYFVIKNGGLENGINGSMENISKAMVLDGFDFDMDITNNDSLDPDFKDMMDRYEELCKAYVDYASSSNPVALIVNYIKMNQRASAVNKKIETVKGKKLSATDYYYMLEVEARVANSYVGDYFFDCKCYVDV